MIAHRSVILMIQDLGPDTRWPELLGDAGLTSLMLHAVRLPENISQILEYMSCEHGRELKRALNRRGIGIEYEMHTATYLLPRMEAQRELAMFRMDRFGRRSSDCNFCFSSEAAWQVAAPRAASLFRSLPTDTWRWLLFPDDIAEAACHCPLCQHLTPSDQAMLYANRLLAVARDVDARATVSYLAYHATLEPPEQVEPDEGVFVEFAPIQRCYRHALDDESCGINRRHLAMLARLRGRLGRLPLHITEYWLDAGLQSRRVRPHDKLAVPLEIIERDIRAYDAMGATSVTTYCCGCDGEYWRQFGPPPVVQYGAFLRGERP